MKKTFFIWSLVLAIGVPAFAQRKEKKRIEDAGNVMKEILDIPDDIPQDVIDKADCIVVLPSVRSLPSVWAAATAAAS